MEELSVCRSCEMHKVLKFSVPTEISEISVYALCMNDKFCHYLMHTLCFVRDSFILSKHTLTLSDVARRVMGG